MHLLAEKVIIEGLLELGLIKKKKEDETVQDLIDARVAYYFMPHGLGHLMGLEVHDVGGYLSFTPPRIDKPGLSSLRSGRILSVNTVMTVEPGIYFIPYLLENGFKDEKIKDYLNESALKEYYDFGGVRIEDDVIVTADGCINMTADLPRTVEEIEKIMSEK